MTSSPAPGRGASHLDAAVQRLIDLLDDLPAFDPCRGPAHSWPEPVRVAYLPVWYLWPRDMQGASLPGMKETWWAYGRGRLLKIPPSGSPVIFDVPGSGTAEMQPAIERVLAAPAHSIPQFVTETLPSAMRQPEVVVENVWFARQQQVARIRNEIDSVLPAAERAVNRAAGDAKVLKALATDGILDVETVDAVVAQLKRALPPVMEVTEHASTTNNPALLTGKQAADVIGVSEGTLSRWRLRIPAWAQSNVALFLHLVDRERGRYHRHNTRKLAKWYDAAKDAGEQKPVDCP